MMVSADGEYGVMMQEQETYLGDGCYVSLEPHIGIKLRAPRVGGDHVVYMEPAVFDAFLTWCNLAGVSTEPPASR